MPCVAGSQKFNVGVFAFQGMVRSTCMVVVSRHAERGGQKGSSPGGPETQRGRGFRIVKIECKTTAYGRH